MNIAVFKNSTNVVWDKLMASKNSTIEKEGCKSGPNTGGSELVGHYRLRQVKNEKNPFKHNSGKLF